MEEVEQEESNASGSKVFVKNLKVGDVFSFTIEHDTFMREVIEIEANVTSFSEVFIHYEVLGENKRGGGMTFMNDDIVLLLEGDDDEVRNV